MSIYLKNNTFIIKYLDGPRGNKWASIIMQMIIMEPLVHVFHVASLDREITTTSRISICRNQYTIQ